MSSNVVFQFDGATQILQDPLTHLNPGVRHLHGYVRAVNIPRDISNEPNAREVRKSAKNYKAIRESLLLNDGKFHLKSKGITLLATDVEQTGEGVFRCILTPGLDGLVDGGHTYAVVSEALAAESAIGNQFVPVTIRVGCAQSDLAGICQGLNTSVHVSRSSLNNRRGLYEWLKSIVEGGVIPGQIKWKDNSPGAIDASSVINILSTLTPSLWQNGHPTSAYSSKNTMIAKFEQNQQAFVNLEPLVLDALSLYDILATELATTLRRRGADERTYRGATIKTQLFSWSVPAKSARVPNAVILPTIAAFRALVVQQKDGSYVFDRSQQELLGTARSLLPEIADEVERHWAAKNGNPNDFGKSAQLWADLYRLVAKRATAVQRLKAHVDPSVTSALLSQCQARIALAKRYVSGGQGLVGNYSDVSLAAAHEEARRKAESVLEAIQSGDIGTCVVCGNEVEASRLNKFTSALHCLPCASGGARK